jgi:hypothetical protein
MVEQTMLNEELAFFDKNLPEWLEKHAGRVVLVKGHELVGFFDDEGQAIGEGARRFGLQSFLVRRIERVPEEVCIPALTLGILRGNSACTVRV